MKIAYFTQPGPKNSDNQDGIFICGYVIRKTPEPQKMLLPNGHGLFMVLDGLGGVAGGDVATELILQSFEHAHAPQAPDCATIESMIYKAAKLLRHEACENTELAEMGAACAGIWIVDSHVFYFNCGDCRVYLAQDGHVDKLTHDHSLVQNLLDRGMIGDEELRQHPDRNVLLTAISAQPQKPEVFCEAVFLHGGELFLLCSDGVWEMFPSYELNALLQRGMNPAIAALRSGAARAKDDYSFVLIENT